MSQRAKVQVHLNAAGTRGKIFLDGVDVSRVVRGIKINSSVGEIATVTLELIADYELLFDAAAIETVRALEVRGSDDLIQTSHLGGEYHTFRVDRKAD